MAGRKKKRMVGCSKADVAKRRALFIEAMSANGGNVTDAYISAGFAASNDHAAAAAGHKLMQIPAIREAIEKRRAEVLAAAMKKTQLTVDEVLASLARDLRFDPAKLYRADGSLKSIDEMDEETRMCLRGAEVDEIRSTKGDGAALRGFTTKVKFPEKTAAREQGMKHFGLYKRDNEQKPPTVLMPGVKTVKFEVFKGRGKDIA